MDDLHKVRYVHRNMLKAQVRPQPSVHSPTSPPLLVSNDNSSCDGDLWILVPETPVPPATAVLGLPGATGLTSVTPVGVISLGVKNMQCAVFGANGT